MMENQQRSGDTTIKGGMICLSPFEVERVNVKPAVEHSALLTYYWFLTSFLLSHDFL